MSYAGKTARNRRRDLIIHSTTIVKHFLVAMIGLRSWYALCSRRFRDAY